jgi:hypothetical protein
VQHNPLPLELFRYKPHAFRDLGRPVVAEREVEAKTARGKKEREEEGV